MARLMKGDDLYTESKGLMMLRIRDCKGTEKQEEKKLTLTM